MTLFSSYPQLINKQRIKFLRPNSVYRQLKKMLHKLNTCFNQAEREKTISKSVVLGGKEQGRASRMLSNGSHWSSTKATVCPSDNHMYVMYLYIVHVFPIKWFYYKSRTPKIESHCVQDATATITIMFPYLVPVYLFKQYFITVTWMGLGSRLKPM